MVGDARARPGQINYATAGIGTMMHVAMVQLCNRAGVQLTHVPYRGGAPALADALAGQVSLFVTNAPVGGPHVRSGALKGFGVTTRAPWRDLPGVPSFQELGFAGFEAPTWWAFLGRAGTPEPVLARIREALGQALAAIRQLGMNIPLLLLLDHFFGMTGIIWTQVTADALTAAISYLIYAHVKCGLEVPDGTKTGSA